MANKKKNTGKSWKAKRHKHMMYMKAVRLDKKRNAMESTLSNKVVFEEVGNLNQHSKEDENAMESTISDKLVFEEIGNLNEHSKEDDSMVTDDVNEIHKKIETLTVLASEADNDDEFLNETQNDTVQGRRIVDFAYVNKKLQEISVHNSFFNCGLYTMSLVGEIRVGLRSKFKYSCNMCKQVFYIDSEDPLDSENVNANIAAVSGIISSGIGFSQFEEIAACLDLPIFTNKYFTKVENELFDKWEKTAMEEMQGAAERERKAAIAEGRLKDGIPIIDVIADGCWSARSYGTNYKALSGAAVIIGRRFGEVLFMAVKNKYCLICARAEKKNVSPKEHRCFKNYTGSSSGMEADIICDGFLHSVEMYNIIYGRLIADGDSSTYMKILNSNPYPNHTVEKIECRNHLLRNMCKHLRAVTKDTKYPISTRKQLSDQKIMSIRKVITNSIKHYEPQKTTSTSQVIQNLYSDIQNSILHAFGDHQKCLDHYCTKDKVLLNSMEITNTTLWFRLKVIIGSVASKSRSLIENVDTNSAERFNSIVAKLVGGKRINFTQRRSYQGRCAAAVVSYNNDFPLHNFHKKIIGQSPKRSWLKKMEVKRLKKKKLNNNYLRKKNRFLNKNSDPKNEHDYGKNCATPDLNEEELKTASESFLNNLKDLTADKDKILEMTILQRDSSHWIDLRKNMLTASNFGAVIKRRKNISSAPLVKNILYKKKIDHVASVAHGIKNEQLALQQLAIQENVLIKPCGLFIDNTYPFLGATPDGVIESSNMIVEVKCPVAAYKKGIDEAIKENKVQIWKYNKQNKTHCLNKTSNWYYQVQGQLHVTRSERCLFAVWGGENINLKTEYIERDDNFWASQMEEKLVTFYMNCMLPELVDPRNSRGLPIRDSNFVEKENKVIETVGIRNINESDKDNFVSNKIESTENLHKPKSPRRILNFLEL